MNIIIRLFKLSLPAVMLIWVGLVVSACSSQEDAPEKVTELPTPQIIVMYGLGGLGDQGYMDRILTGVQQFKRAHYSEVDIYQFSPSAMEDAERCQLPLVYTDSSTFRPSGCQGREYSFLLI